MRKIDNNELEITIGGASSFSGAIINAITGLVKYVYSLGQSFGSSFRRIASGKLCGCK